MALAHAIMKQGTVALPDPVPALSVGIALGRDAAASADALMTCAEDARRDARSGSGVGCLSLRGEGP